MKPTSPTDARLTFADGGAELHRGAVRDAVDLMRSVLGRLPRNRAGVRISDPGDLDPLLRTEGPVGAVAADVLGSSARPVRAVLFDKTAETNWSLAWHQDRTICVQRRRDVGGFGPWTVKAGMQHVVPPFDLLARMVTLRVHLDDVSEGNAPLLIAPGSHRYGRVAVADVADVVRRCGTHVCTARTGDIWLYATPILHASDAARIPARRRVLQVDYSADSLPTGLDWLGV